MPTTPLHIVTGATRGIGRAVAAALAARGHRVVAVGRSTELLDSLVETSGSLVSTVAADLATKHGIDKLVAHIAAEGEIASVLHSAGSLVPLEPYASIDSDELVEHFRIHVGAPISLYQAVSRNHSIRRMLFIDSYSASAARLGWAAYSVIKSAAQMAARCAAQELPDTLSTRVFPGAVNTRIVETVLASDTATASTFAGMLERGEFAEPEEVAEFLVALLLDATDELFCSREAFDYNNPVDRADVGGI